VPQKSRLKRKLVFRGEGLGGRLEVSGGVSAGAAKEPSEEKTSPIQRLIKETYSEVSFSKETYSEQKIPVNEPYLHASRRAAVPSSPEP